jgi:outer membrane protein W
MNRKYILLFAAVGILLIAVPNAEAKKGFYMGIGAAYNTIHGDFNGAGGLVGTTEIIILPAIDNALGIDLHAGYGITDAWAVELDIIASDHSGNWQGLKGDVYFTSFSINGKYNFQSSTKIQPYLMFGLSGNTLVINDGATGLYTGAVGDATLSGSGVNLGAGIENYIAEHLSLSLGLLYRVVEYDQAEGVGASGTIDNAVDGSGFSLLLTTTYHF